MDFDWRMSLEIKDTDSGVKSDRELANDRAGGTIQTSSSKRVADQRSESKLILRNF